MIPTIQSPEDFLLNEVIVTFEDNTTKLNLTKTVVEINLYESLQSAYLTGSVTMVDDADVIDLFKFRGTERLYFSVSLPIPNFTPIIKHFVILNMEDPIKVNDHTMLVTFNLIEDIGFLGNIEKFSKMYVGVGEQILGKIVTDKLKRKIYNWDERNNRFGNLERTFIPSAQNKFQYIVPNINTIEAINYVKNKLTTPNGLPYFLLSSLVTNDLIIRDLETILKGTAFNKDTPFVFSQSNTNSGVDDPRKAVFSIYQFDAQSANDTMLLAQQGGMGSYYQYRHMTTGEQISGHLNVHNIIRNLVDIGVIPLEESEMLTSEFFVPVRQTDDVRSSATLQEYNSRFFRGISASTYTDNVTNYNEEKYLNQHILQITSYVIMQYLVKDLYTISVPGFLFLSNDINRSVGNLIELRSFKTNIPHNIREMSLSIDTNRSGNFVMLQKRHIFDCTSFRHKVNIQCGRISKKQGVL